MSPPAPDLHPPQRWYQGISRYEWLVLLIASLGWVFDIFEGQIFVATMGEAMPSLVAEGTTKERIALYNNIALAGFLAGGALGGIMFGMLADRIGRKRVMSLTILFYSLFTCVSAFSQEWWHLAITRFLVAMGVGGEWAVASAMVAEVFPNRARTQVGGIFHASSVLGTLLAVAAGMILIDNQTLYAWAHGPSMAWAARLVDPDTIPWRFSFALGVLPALLIIWIRISLREPDSWVEARQRAMQDSQQQPSVLVQFTRSIADLFHPDRRRSTLVGVTLATVGLATFWGGHIYGKNVLKEAAARAYPELAPPAQEATTQAKSATKAAVAAPAKSVPSDSWFSLKGWELMGMLLVTLGGGAGLITFGLICEGLGRRKTFLLFHLGGLASALLLFQLFSAQSALYRDWGYAGAPPSIPVLLVMLPIFGYLTLGMHAGYAIYFPELYPTRLRGTGTGFCFNAGRIIAAPVLLFSGWFRDSFGVTLPDAASLVSLLFLVGAAVLILAPETKGRELPSE